jgi:dTDP-4-dehydrorhamnose reductase
MDVVVLGAGGLLGSNVVLTAQTQGASVAGTYHSDAPSFKVPMRQLDIRDEDPAGDVLAEFEPDVVVNCAAMTDVDDCEEHPDQAFAVNGRSPGAIAEECHERGIAFVQVSTNYVFDGTATEPYAESASPNPIQVYGESKLAGEHAVHEAHPGALQVRLSFVWGIHRATGELTGFPAWVRDQLAAGEPTPLFTDQFVTPTRAGAAVSTILELVDDGTSGMFHVAARNCVTPHEIGTRICELMAADSSLIDIVRRTELDRPADRPPYTCLDVENVERTLDRPQPTLAEDLEAVSALL